MLNYEIGDPFLGGFRPATKQNINEFLQRHDYPSVLERLRISLLRTPKKLEEREVLQVAADELDGLKVDDIREWFKSHINGLGYTRLRTLLNGYSVEDLQARARETGVAPPKTLENVLTELQVAADEFYDFKADLVSKMSKWWNENCVVLGGGKLACQKLRRLL